MRLEDLRPLAAITGIHPETPVTVISTQFCGSDAVELTYKAPDGAVDQVLLFRQDEDRLKLVSQGRPWSFDGDGALFRLVSEAQRIHLAHLFDPHLAVHTSEIEPLPHQISAVYESMLPRQPLRFLLADDPGAGKTIMAGLLIKELIARGDLERCLIVCPGSLAEQWQYELNRRFYLSFDILTNDKLRSASSNNWFLQANLVIARLDKLARDEDVQQKLQAPDAGWDLVVFDEAHKLSATYFGGEIKYTKRYRLAQLVSGLTRHLLLMTATPHNGKETDFQLFLALLDGDRFEGRFRDGVHTANVSDLMRRMVKERLVKFDGKPLFPERRAATVQYKLSDEEARLYSAVTNYVREEFNRAEKLANAKNTIGFALTMLQRRLASSPEAIYRSLRRRRERLESRLRELEVLRRGDQLSRKKLFAGPVLDSDDIEDLDDLYELDSDSSRDSILDEATAARSITELKAEIDTLKDLESLALSVRRTGLDTKWRELSGLLNEIFSASNSIGSGGEPQVTQTRGTSQEQHSISSRKLVIFTEYVDTLRYLQDRISTWIGIEGAVCVIHGGIGRKERLKVQEDFWHNPTVQILLATDAAGEGINLHRSHLMINYDLPWNPNRLEQRFGRIHRIGQSEVCHLWNLVAADTREGDVYLRLLEKLEQARKALGGQVFDVLGKLEFDGEPLRDLLLRAVRYGERPEVRERLRTVLNKALDRKALQEMLEERQLALEVMDVTRIQRVRTEIERAAARRLQPHYVESFFREAFQRLGGSIWRRELGCYEVTHVPESIRNRGRMIGIREPVLRRYERIVFDKPKAASPGLSHAAFIFPGHPLLNAVIDLTLEYHKSLLKQGAILVDARDPSTKPRLLFSIEHAVQDMSVTRSGDRHVISKRVLYVEISSDGTANHLNYAPYLDYRPLDNSDPTVNAILDHQECAWIKRDLEKDAQMHCIAHVAPKHLEEVRTARLALIEKTKVAVKDRLTKEIFYWDHRAEQLKLDEAAGKSGARLTWSQARRRADNLQERLQRRLSALKRDAQISSRSPVVLGGLLVIPQGLINLMDGQPVVSVPEDTTQAAARARTIVMDMERSLGFVPVDRETEKLGYDIESQEPSTGKLRFIEVKGRRSDADTITVTRNEILYSLNKPEEFILAIVLFHGGTDYQLHYVPRPFQRKPDFGVTSMNYRIKDLLAKAEVPH